MTLDDLKALLSNRLSTLAQQRTLAFTMGDVQRVNELDAEIADTELTVSQLESIG